MENTIEINQKIAKNIAAYRKAAGMTQAELADKINYSDKSVSKWESGNGAPDVYTLMLMAELFGVTLNDLVGEEKPVQQTETKMPKPKGLQVLIMLLSSGIVWLVATCVFVLLQLAIPYKHVSWLTFIVALPVNAIVLVVLSSVWKYRLVGFFSVSTLIWTAILCTFLIARTVCLANGWSYSGWWTLFLLGAPLQVLEILWVFFRANLLKRRNQFAEKIKAAEEKKAAEKAKKKEAKAAKKAEKQAKKLQKLNEKKANQEEVLGEK